MSPNRPLTLSGIADSNQAENSAYTSATPSLSGTPIGSVTYTLKRDDAGLFTVNSSTGVVEMVARDFEALPILDPITSTTTHSLPPMTMATQTASLLLSPSPMSPNSPLTLGIADSNLKLKIPPTHPPLPA